METEIRRAMSTSRLTNASNPEVASDVPLGSERPNHLFFASSAYAAEKESGSAANTTLSPSSTAMSSSSEIWASRAPSSSSRAIPNETLKARSEPSAPSATLVGPDIDSDDSLEATPLAPERFSHAVDPSDVFSCVSECYGQKPRLAWQVPEVELHLRRLMLSAHGEVRTKRTGSGSGSGSTVDTGGIRKPQIRRRRNNCAISQSIGQLFGCTMGNLMTYARGHKHSLKVARNRMELVLEPVCEAMTYITGDDQPYLVRGLGYHRVVGNLASRLPELRQCFEISDRGSKRRAHTAVAYGAVMSLLIVFAILSAAPLDEELLEPVLEPACVDMHSALRNWHSRGHMDYGAIGAEVRAAQRALHAVRLARRRAQTAGLGSGESLRMQLSFYRRAAWPAGQRVGIDEQEALLKRLESGELVDVDRVQQGPVANAVNAPGVLPLSQLSSAMRPRVLRDDDAQSMSSHSQSVSTSNSWASWASWGSAASGGSGGGTAASRDMARRLSDVGI